MPPRLLRTALTAAVAVTAIAAPAPAHASPACTAVTGTVTIPTFVLSLTPGVFVEGTPQTVALASSPVATRTAVLTCVTVAGDVTYAGDLDWQTATASGASYGTEDLATGAGLVDGIGVSGHGAASSATPNVGRYGFDASADASASLTYVREAGTVAIAVTLHGLTVDVDGPGPLAPSTWGDVTVDTATGIVASPLGVLSDLVEYGRVRRIELTPSVAAAAG
jgi:hypothetical protein